MSYYITYPCPECGEKIYVRLMGSFYLGSCDKCKLGIRGSLEDLLDERGMNRMVKEKYVTIKGMRGLLVKVREDGMMETHWDAFQCFLNKIGLKLKKEVVVEDCLLGD